MKRVLVIGSGGAGKSTLARRLHEITGLELIHLDTLYWKPGWTETPADKWRKTLKRVIEGERWILDGNFGGTLEMRLEACDTVVFLETRPSVCVYRALKRIVRYRGKTRPDLPAGCPERFDWDFLKWIWSYPQTSARRVERLIGKFAASKRIIRLRNKRQTEEFLVRVAAEIRAAGPS